MRYRSNKNISFSLLVEGADKRFRFNPCMQGGSIYVTNVPAEIKALEASSMFNRVYHRAPGCEDEKIPREKKQSSESKNSSAIEVPEVKSWQEAKEYLNTQYNIDMGKLVSPESIMSEATAKGIKFPNIQ